MYTEMHRIDTPISLHAAKCTESLRQDVAAIPRCPLGPYASLRNQFPQVALRRVDGDVERRGVGLRRERPDRA